MRHVLRSLVLMGVLSAVLLIAGPAAAGPAYSNNDLKGEYLFTVVEVRNEILPGMTTPTVNYCVIAGTANFDGIGTAALSSGTQRCSATGTVTPSGKPLFYSVNPDGSFLMSESPDMSDPIHGQLVEHGRSLLLDGTLRTLPDILSWHGVAMKR